MADNDRERVCLSRFLYNYIKKRIHAVSFVFFLICSSCTGLVMTVLVDIAHTHSSSLIISAVVIIEVQEKLRLFLEKIKKQRIEERCVHEQQCLAALNGRR